MLTRLEITYPAKRIIDWLNSFAGYHSENILTKLNINFLQFNIFKSYFRNRI